MAQLIESPLQPAFPFAGAEQRGQRDGQQVPGRNAAEFFQIEVRQQRVGQLQHVTILGLFRENVALASDVADERHHDLFANRVNRRIRDLREELFEIIEERLRPVGKTSERSIRPHRAHRFLAFRGHGAENHAYILIAVAEGTLAAKQGLGIRLVHARGSGQLIDRDLIVFEPLRIGLPRCQSFLDFFIGDYAPFDRIDQEHLSRLQAALHLDLLRRNVEHSGFGSHNHMIVVGDHIAPGTQAVAIEERADHPAVGKRDRCRPIPRFHQARVILVKCALLRLHVRVSGPRFRNQHGHGVGQAAPRLKKKFDRVVEVRRITAVRRNDREKLLYIVSEQGGLQQRLARVHPVDVAPERVDLTVVRDIAIRMRPLPAWKRVGGETLMHQAQGAGHLGIGKLLVEIRDLRGQQQAFVNDGAARERRNVEYSGILNSRGGDLTLGALAHHVEFALESVFVGQ